MSETFNQGAKEKEVAAEITIIQIRSTFSMTLRVFRKLLRQRQVVLSTYLQLLN